MTRSVTAWSLAILGYLLCAVNSAGAAPETAPNAETSLTIEPGFINLCNQSKSKVRYILNSQPQLLSSGEYARHFYNRASTIKPDECQKIANQNKALQLTLKRQIYTLEPSYNYTFKKLDHNRGISLYREK